VQQGPLHARGPEREGQMNNEAKARSMVLTVDGRAVPMNDFVRAVIEGAVRGMIASLKDVDPGGEISLTIGKKPA
jgi:hypothetical protein